MPARRPGRPPHRRLRLRPGPERHRSRRCVHRRRRPRPWKSPNGSSRRKRPADELDSLATWPTEDGLTWLIATGKSTHRLVGLRRRRRRRLRTFGSEGSGHGQFNRPNGIAVLRRPRCSWSSATTIACRCCQLPDFTLRRHLRRERTAQPVRPVGQRNRTGRARGLRHRQLHVRHEVRRSAAAGRNWTSACAAIACSSTRTASCAPTTAARSATPREASALRMVESIAGDRAQRPPADRRRGSPPRIHAARIQLLRPATPAAACRRTASPPKPKAWRCGPARTAAVTGSRSTSSRR